MWGQNLYGVVRWWLGEGQGEKSVVIKGGGSECWKRGGWGRGVVISEGGVVKEGWECMVTGGEVKGGVVGEGHCGRGGWLRRGGWGIMIGWVGERVVVGLEAGRGAPRVREGE